MFQYEKQSPVGLKKKGKGGEKDLFVVIALKARSSTKVKTTDLQVCLHIWG